MLIDLRNKGITGKEADQVLGMAHITVNKNMVPYDDKSPMVTSGIRVGTPALTTRGLREEDMELVVEWMDQVLINRSREDRIAGIRSEIAGYMERFPLFAGAAHA